MLSGTGLVDLALLLDPLGTVGASVIANIVVGYSQNSYGITIQHTCPKMI